MTWSYPWWFFSTARFNPGGPTWYDDDRRMPAKLYMERSTMGILSTVVTLLFMFLVILPIIRYRLHSAITALHVLATGFIISLCMVTPDWLSGSADIQSVMSHYSSATYQMRVGLHIGLSSYNATLEYLSTVPVQGNASFEPSTTKFWYNEMVMMYHPEDLENVMENSLSRGMPTPLLTVMHFMTSSTLGFEWPHQVAEAGFHCYITLLFALLAWGFSVLFIAFIPRYSSYGFIATGWLLMATVVIYLYWAMIDLVFPCIVVEGQFIKINHGVCFWACLATGVWCIVYGFTLAVLDITHPDSFLTIFDIDYEHKRTLARAHRVNEIPQRASIKNLQYLENCIGPQ